MSTLAKVKVENMRSLRYGSYARIPNQFIIETPEGLYFQSYQTIIAFKPFGSEKTILDPKYDYSKTTGKYRNDFLGEKIKETREKIENGTYIIQELN